MKTRLKQRVGEVYVTNEGYNIKIIEYNGKNDCSILYENGHIIKNIEYSQIKKGSVRNLYHPSVCGKGYLGEGDYKSVSNGKITKWYSTWSGMIKRCYYDGYLKKFPTYRGCSVMENWLNFQVFAEWFENNYKEGFELDKDILIKGNKIYSLKTCCFVPKEINYLFTKTDSKRGDLPIGVKRKGSTYEVAISINSKSVYLGCYKTIEEAFQAYKTAKEEYIKEVANKWKNQITPQVYKALINYKVEITD